jgi:hypothetical protein
MTEKLSKKNRCLMCLTACENWSMERMWVVPFSCNNFHLLCEKCFWSDIDDANGRIINARLCWEQLEQPSDQKCIMCDVSGKEWATLKPRAQKCKCHWKHDICTGCVKKDPKLIDEFLCPCTVFCPDPPK